METLACGANVLAPHVGAFKDAQEEGLIRTYGSFEELVKFLDESLTNIDNYRDRIDGFIQENDWKRFSEKVSRWITETS
jgi:hypothetical protein